MASRMCLACLLASLLLGCRNTTDPSTSTTTAPPNSTILSEPLGLAAESEGGGRGWPFSVDGPGTVIVHWRGEIVPAGGSADFVVTLLRYVDGQLRCESWEGVLCLGIRNARNEKEATLTYEVEQGRHGFNIVLRNLGPNGVSGHVTVDFNRR